MNKKHSHRYTYSRGRAWGNRWYDEGAFDLAYVDANTSEEGGIESRPLNFTVKVWKRIN